MPVIYLYLFVNQFWRGSLGEASQVFSTQQPRGEITLLIEGKANSVAEIPSDSQIEHHLKVLISNGHSLSTVWVESQAYLISYFVES